MSEICRITVPVDPNDTSPNQRGHWLRRNRLRKVAYDAARWAWEAAKKPKASGPVRVSYIVRRGRVLDDDNAIGGVKPIRDALFNHGITKSDSPEWVTTGSVTQETGKRYAMRPEVVVIVETRE